MSDMATEGVTALTSMYNAERAEDAQHAASQNAIAYQQMQQADAAARALPYEELGKKGMGQLDPYTTAGQQALGGLSQYGDAGSAGLEGQKAILGMLGGDAQQAQYDEVLNSPQYQEMVKQGEAGMLKNASATGGLRGGDMQRALAEYRPAVMNDLINQRYGRFGDLADKGGNIAQFLASSGQNIGQNYLGLGQAAAAGVGANAMNSGARISNLITDQGANAAGFQNAKSMVAERMNASHQSSLNDFGDFVGSMYGAGGMG